MNSPLCKVFSLSPLTQYILVPTGSRFLNIIAEKYSPHRSHPTNGAPRKLQVKDCCGAGESVSRLLMKAFEMASLPKEMTSSFVEVTSLYVVMTSFHKLSPARPLSFRPHEDSLDYCSNAFVALCTACGHCAVQYFATLRASHAHLEQKRICFGQPSPNARVAKA